MKKLFSKGILKLSLTSAKVSCGSASVLGLYQTKEPKELSEKIARIEAEKAEP